MCQEYILQWKQRIAELERQHIRLVLISIGKPQVGQQLLTHLEFDENDDNNNNNGDNYLFVDAQNALYDALDLNRGVQRTFFNINTPFAFLDRFSRGDTRELGEILKKWNKAFYIPPKQTQGLLQGGTFVFDGSETLFAHYDPSTAAHASVDLVLEIASKAMAAHSTQQ